MILAIDPGTTQSAWCVFDGSKVVDCDTQENSVVLQKLRMGFAKDYKPAIEMIASYGMPVGKEVFETCLWIGRFIEACSEREPVLIYRKDVKLHLCQSTRAKDPNVRQALIDRFEPLGGGKVPQIGTAKKPGPLYGVSSHVWAALAVAVTFHDTRKLR
jgi:hypothetical protein